MTGNVKRYWTTEEVLERVIAAKKEERRKTLNDVAKFLFLDDHLKLRMLKELHLTNRSHDRQL